MPEAIRSGDIFDRDIHLIDPDPENTRDVDSPVARADIEEWKAVGEGRPYEVSSFGRVRYRGEAHAGTYPGRFLKISYEKSGYARVSISRHRYVRLHVLVCRAFHGPAPSPKHEVAHWDGRKANCRAHNLRWATKLENKSDDKRHGIRMVGSKNPGATLTEADIPKILSCLKDGLSQSNVAKKFGVTQPTIGRIARGGLWTHITRGTTNGRP